VGGLSASGGMDRWGISGYLQAIFVRDAGGHWIDGPNMLSATAVVISAQSTSLIPEASPNRGPVLLQLQTFQARKGGVSPAL
jgi:hypothetical protein